MADSKVSTLPEASTLNSSDKLYLVQSGDSKSITASTLFGNIRNAAFNGNINLDSNIQYLGSNGVVDLTRLITHIGIPAINSVLDLPNGTNSQLKILLAISTIGANAIVQGNIANSANIRFNEVGDTATLLYSNNVWFKIGGTVIIE
jgi:hypothetical protein